MKKLLLIVIASAALLTMTPDTVEARWRFGFGVFYDYCDCYWGEPSPWDPWWDCPCYWDVWEWCAVHPYWMWPRWCRRFVEVYYSPCGRYYYTYYDHHVPHSRRVWVDGRYRYRYEVPLGSTYSITERIPRRSGLERPAGTPPMPEPVHRTLANLGPEYRVKSVAVHSEPTSPRQSTSAPHTEPSRERPATEGVISSVRSDIPVRGAETTRNESLRSRDSETGAVSIQKVELGEPVKKSAKIEEREEFKLKEKAIEVDKKKPVVSDKLEEKAKPEDKKPVPSTSSRSSTRQSDSAPASSGRSDGSAKSFRNK